MSSSGPATPRWRYDKGGEQNRLKHAWDRPHAGFVEVDGKTVGKCPSGTTHEQREALLNEGIPYEGDDLGLGVQPQRIYVVHDGFVYRAKVTNAEAGTWHAFPETSEELRRLPRALWNLILTRARVLGCEREVARLRRG